jgi:Fuc2NAc and GlcNAc transferase
VSPLELAVPALLAAALLTGLVRRFALTHELFDVPNERSSHTVPTPRGGGLAVVAIVLDGAGLLALAGRIPAGIFIALLGGALVAWIGWIDDRRGLPAWVRLASHFGAAAWALWWLGGMPTLTIGAGTAELGLFGSILACVAIVWAINLTNFMDGIDGLASSETATVSFTAAALLAPANPGLAATAAVTGGAALGFLVWNWQPARIFLGDVGSGFLGFVLATLGVASERSGAVPVAIWILLYMVFAVDGTVTLVRRAARGERWYTAHRSHAYQRGIQAGWSHRAVTLGVVALNLVLAGLAWWALADLARLGPALGAAIGICGAAYAVVERLRPMEPVPRPARVDNPSG